MALWPERSGELFRGSLSGSLVWCSGQDIVLYCCVINASHFSVVALFFLIIIVEKVWIQACFSVHLVNMESQTVVKDCILMTDRHTFPKMLIFLS